MLTVYIAIYPLSMCAILWAIFGGFINTHAHGQPALHWGQSRVCSLMQLLAGLGWLPGWVKASCSALGVLVASPLGVCRGKTVVRELSPRGNGGNKAECVYPDRR